METNKIEEIIRKNLQTEKERCIGDIVRRNQSELTQAIDHINGVYNSAINTLKKLEILKLPDATVFDFFQQTDGNIRVFEIKGVDSEWQLNILYGGRILEEYSKAPIRLKEKTAYKIIVMAMELKEK
ncbi:MAG: hypothetical protein Q8J68_08060 [Methanolobus sp.]|uniref:hypothetical protein n=1 Tax=Methanolobus sp. TaxID=1874737 RepID=UPI00272F9538|nr:hypothetical protein [Methanolobus sp.]MDP2217223.1 hypothetical protein [Methanolobus sp.]